MNPVKGTAGERRLEGDKGVVAETTGEKK